MDWIGRDGLVWGVRRLSPVGRDLRALLQGLVDGLVEQPVSNNVILFHLWG